MEKMPAAQADVDGLKLKTPHLKILEECQPNIGGGGGFGLLTTGGGKILFYAIKFNSRQTHKIVQQKKKERE